MARACRAPKSVSVRGYWRKSRRRKRRRRARAAPKGPYWACVDRHGRACGSHHRTLSGAVAHSRRLNRAERAKRGRYSTRKNKLAVNDWIPERK